MNLVVHEILGEEARTLPGSHIGALLHLMGADDDVTRWLMDRLGLAPGPGRTSSICWSELDENWQMSYEYVTPAGQVLKLTESVVGRGMTAVLITPSTEPEWVTAVFNLLLRGVHPTTLLLDARSFGGQNGSIQATVRSLADVGVRTQLIDRSLKLEEMATRQPEEAGVRTRGLAPRPDRSPQRRLGPQWMPLGQE